MSSSYQPFDAQRTEELGLVTRVVPDQTLLTTATETAQKLAEKPADALKACKRLMRQPVRAQVEQAAELENEEYAVRVRSADAKEAFTAFIEKRELVARGVNVMRGCWNDPENTALVFRNGMFRTGDFGYQDSDGYFYILDRLKDMIVIGGENVYSGEVEAVIYKHPAVREVAVFGIPDPHWGEVVMACIVLKPRMALSANNLTSHCRQFLANCKIPRRVEFSDTELPKSGSGKILKRILRECFWAHEERAVG